MNDIEVIKCPVCGREYLPVEIFVPNAFFGEPDVVKRDTEGNIVIPFRYTSISNASTGLFACFSETDGWKIFAKVTK